MIFETYVNTFFQVVVCCRQSNPTGASRDYSCFTSQRHRFRFLPEIVDKNIMEKNLNGTHCSQEVKLCIGYCFQLDIKCISFIFEIGLLPLLSTSTTKFSPILFGL